MYTTSNKPLFNKFIFWDTDFEKLEYDKDAGYIITRVFERGDVEDIRQCRRYYGDEVIKKNLLNAKYLPESRLYLASAIINEPPNAFRCYTLRQLNREQFPY